MRYLPTVICLAAIAVTASAAAPISFLSAPQAPIARSTADLSDHEKNFLKEATKGSMFEVKMGKLAVEKGTNQSTRDFGNRMVQDHTKALAKVQAVAVSKGVKVPDDIGDKQQEMYDKLSNSDKSGWDKRYLQEMIDDHEQDIKQTEKISTNGKDADVKALATDLLPTFKDHLDHAKRALAEIKD